MKQNVEFILFVFGVGTYKKIIETVVPAENEQLSVGTIIFIIPPKGITKLLDTKVCNNSSIVAYKVFANLDPAYKKQSHDRIVNELLNEEWEKWEPNYEVSKNQI